MQMNKTTISLVYGQHYNNFRIPECYFLLQHAFAEAGVDARLNENLVDGQINIIVEGFKEEFSSSLPAFCRASGSKLFVLGTEFITDGNFNQFSQGNNTVASHYDNFNYWAQRFTRLQQATPYINGLFHLSENQVSTYQSTFDKPTHYIPHGAIKSMVNPITYTNKNIDVLFTGVMTPYREAILTACKNSGLSVAVGDTNTPAYLRADLNARSKVAVNIKQNEQWLHPSNSRFHYHLTNGTCLLSEATTIKCDLSRYVKETSYENLVSTINELLSDDRYLDIGRTAQQDFFEHMPMAAFMPDIIQFIQEN